MSSRCVWLASLLCLAFVAWRSADAAPAPEDKTRPHTDQYGDPLPDGALARIGTVRFRHGSTVYEVPFSPDGKTLAAIGAADVRLWDPATGRELRHYEGSPSFYRGCWFPDGRGLWLQTYQGAIYSWDLTKDGRGPTPAPFKGEHTWFVAASPDGKTLAAGSKASVCLYDAKTGEELRRLEGHDEDVLSAAFSADGKVLATQSMYDLFVWDPATGEKKGHMAAVRDRTWPSGPFFSDLTLSPDGQLLAAIVGRSIRIWDGGAGKELRPIPIKDASPRSLAFSPDGRLLAVAYENGLRLFRTDDGGEQWHYAPCPNQPFGLAFSPDGKTLAAGFFFMVRLWDVPTGREICPVPEWRDKIGAISLSPDARVLTVEAYTGDGGEADSGDHRNSVDAAPRMFDAVTGRRLLPPPQQEGKPLPAGTLSPDGKTLVTWDGLDTMILWDVASGKERCRLALDGLFGKFLFTPDGRQVVTLCSVRTPQPLPINDTPQKLTSWDTATGKQLGVFQRSAGHIDWLGVSADSRRLATWGFFDGSPIRVWDMDTHREIHRAGIKWEPFGFALSPDLTLLAQAGAVGEPIRLWHVDSGTESPVLLGDEVKTTYKRGVDALLFSGDGRTLYAADNSGMVYAWEIATGRQRLGWKAHICFVSSLSGSADGRILATQAVTDALEWDMASLAGAEPSHGPLSPKQLEALWGDLASDDGARAYRAVWQLAVAPEQSIPFLKDHLPAAAAAEARRIEGLAVDLAGNDAAARGKAALELAKRGRLAEPALRRLLEGKPPDEVRKQAADLLEKSGGPIQEPEAIRIVRAIEVLEAVGDANARKAASVIAEADARGGIGDEARAALGRLAPREAAGR